VVLKRSKEFPFRRVINYYALNDPLLFVTPDAVRALRSGFSRTEREKFVFLSPHSGDPLEDHDLLGPTYKEALRWEGERYCRMYQTGFDRFGIGVRRALEGEKFVGEMVRGFLRLVVIPACSLVMELNALAKMGSKFMVDVLVEYVIIPFLLVLKAVFEEFNKVLRLRTMWEVRSEEDVASQVSFKLNT